MFNLDPAKIVVILAVGLIVLGPERLPEVARKLGALWRDFNLMRDRLTNEIKEALPDFDSNEALGAIVAVRNISSPTRYIRQLATGALVPKEGALASNTDELEGSVTSANARAVSNLVGEGELIWLPDDPRLN